MNTPKFWARASVNEQGHEVDEAYGFIGVGWSDQSEADAHRMALERAKRVASRFVGHDFNDLREEYYTDRPLREPVISELEHAGQRVAVITQNIYGAYVINSASAMFIDIDTPPPAKEPGFIGRLLGKKSPPPAEDPVTKIRRVIGRTPGLGMKVYRTPNGYRGLVTSQPYAPGSSEAEALLRSFESDDLYVKMCKAQQCFRARLTPKPWRIGMDNPPRTFPFTAPQKQQAYDRWRADYDQRSRGYAACEALDAGPWGNADVHADIAPVLAMHDELACSAGKPLA